MMVRQRVIDRGGLSRATLTPLRFRCLIGTVISTCLVVTARDALGEAVHGCV